MDELTRRAAVLAATAIGAWLLSRKRPSDFSMTGAVFQQQPGESYVLDGEGRGGTVYDVTLGIAKGCTTFDANGVERWDRIGVPCQGHSRRLPPDELRFARTSFLASLLE